jgi:hypothetical protein
VASRNGVAAGVGPVAKLTAWIGAGDGPQTHCEEESRLGSGSTVQNGREAGVPLARVEERVRGCRGRLRPGRSSGVVTAIVPVGPRLRLFKYSTPVTRRRVPAMSRVRDEAEALAGALEIGVCDVAEVIAWSDAQILRDDAPLEVLCEVSLAQDRYPQDVADMLRRAFGTLDKSNANRLLVTLLNDRLKGDMGRANQIASALYQMALANEIEDSNLRQVAGWASDALDLAEAGYIKESREQVVGRMADALHRAATKAASTWSIGIGAQEANPPQPDA